MWIKHKLSAIYYISLIILMLNTGCSNESERASYNILEGMSQSAKIESLQTLDDVIYAADYIVIGSLVQQTKHDTSVTLNTIQVDKQLKGHKDIVGQAIDVTSQVPISKDPQSYLLFLDYHDSERFPSPIYISIIHSNPIVDNIFADGPFEEESIDKIVKLVKNSPQIDQFMSYPREIIEKADNLEHLYELSDYIVMLKPTSSVSTNSRVMLSAFEIIEQFKGDEQIKELQYINLPVANLNQEYILFFHNYLEDYENYEGTPNLFLATRTGSMISKEDSTWEATIKFLNSKK